MSNQIKKVFSVVLGFMLMIQLIGCGTLMYPERKGQKNGRIDAGVAILDGLGLLLFVIPGIVAFVVDFNNGTIYLPPTLSVSLQHGYNKQVKFDPKHSSLADIERIVQDETGYHIKMNDETLRISKLTSLDQI